MGEMIRIAREIRGLTLEQLGLMSGVSRQSLGKYEKSGIVPQRALQRIWTALATKAERVQRAVGQLAFDGEELYQKAREREEALEKMVAERDMTIHYLKQRIDTLEAALNLKKKSPEE